MVKDLVTMNSVEPRSSVSLRRWKLRVSERLAYVPSVLLLVALLLASSTGCQLFPDRPEWSKKLTGKEEEAVVPTRMMVMWADTVLHQPQKAGVRGFGARIYFYSEDGPDPVKVDGGLAVYAFDADDVTPKSPKPKRKFVFTPDQFAEYMSHTSMGTSYSVWCPWDEVGGYNQQLSLIVRFEGRNGGVVISDPTVKLLPGMNKPAPFANENEQKQGTVARAAVFGKSGSPTQFAGFQKESTRSPATKPPRRETETIDLPPSFYRHLQGPAQQEATQQGPTQPIGFPAAIAGPEPLESNPADAGSTVPQQDADTVLNSNSKRAIYPRRTLGDEQTDASSASSQPHSLPSGWIPSLPKTPRYGYPNSTTNRKQ